MPSAAPGIYAVPKYAPVLARVVERRGIETLRRLDLGGGVTLHLVRR